jgi:hypothetical protein
MLWRTTRHACTLGHHLDPAFFQGRLPGEGRAANQRVQILGDGRALRDTRAVL